MNTNKSQKGQALILIAFGIVALVGFTALAVDGGRVFSDRRHAQNAADTSALAAALKYIRALEDNPSSAKDLAESEGVARAASNNYHNDPPDSRVIVEFCNQVPVNDPPCNLPGVPSNKFGEYIRVRIESRVPMTFGRILGREFVTNKVEAITRVQGSTTTGAFNAGAGMYSTKMSGDDCYKVLGNAGLSFHDTGIFVNCDGATALSFGGTANIYMDANAQVVGCSDDQNFPIAGTGVIDCGVNGGVPYTINEDTFADVPTTLPTPNCSGNGTKNGNTWQPGNFGSSVNVSDGDVFAPGTYCFLAGLNLGNQSVDFGANGAVQWVLSGVSVSLAGTANFGDGGDSLEIYANDANFTIKNSGTLNADRFRFFGKRNSSFTVQGGTFTSGDTYIFSETGEIDINAQAYVNIEAPPQGDTFGGLLMYMPWGNPNSFELNGGSDDVWKGTVLMPNTNVTYNGGSGFELYGQIIAATFKINGNTGGDIYFSSDYVFSPPSNPTIEFTK